ncbi:polyprenyl synthetase family protein [Brevibacterium jeotgali]|uniref:Geranylgeranyl diphosphate synthase, type II n=1 Tax=Brevibacterium jeotgali TaxID=1262550 RepID=A0A2H1L831_9MICO|nr:polyprenyl synthetase family protein [Brevibacterium jeotgali]TWC03376.1 geranylgeranyl diphosphate synthase type II [Brevibacterium jeotgali]SMY13039.1 geranylgeranyl diphosphate synthase, type II [Brevibacterium jeotgali]
MTVDARSTARARIEQALDRFFDDRVRAGAAYGPDFSDLWARGAEHARGGKLLRPRLFLEAVEAFEATEGPHDPVGQESVDSLAAVIEILHFAFLLHDDVIDGDVVRRHRPNLIGTIRDLHPEAPAASSLHWGSSAAILMGDLLLSSAVLRCARLPLPGPVHARVLDLVDEAITETVAGEQLDVGLGDGAIAPDLSTVLSMTTLKTATYSFALPLRLAGALSGAGPRVDATLAEVGRDLGFAFQVQDDLLTMFGDPAAHGKDVLSDLREGKQTVLVAFLRSTERWHEVADVLGAPALREADADRVRTVVQECGARDFAEHLVAERLREVMVGLDRSLLADPVRRVITDCVERIEGRDA